MRKPPIHILLATVLVASLVLLQGCTSASRNQNESEIPEISQTIRNPESSEDDALPDAEEEPDEQEAEPDPVPSPEEDKSLIQEILLGYGGVYEEPDEDRMKTQVVSLYYADPWSDGEELSPGAYYSWFMTTIWTEDLTDHERMDKYMIPGRDGWVFPQDIYEQRIRGRFDVSVDHLRSDESLYHAEDGVYSISGGGGVGMRPFVELRSVEREDDLLRLVIALEYAEEYEADQTWQLTVQLDEESGYRYRSWERL